MEQQKRGEVFIAPFDVYLNEETTVDCGNTVARKCRS